MSLSGGNGRFVCESLATKIKLMPTAAAQHLKGLFILLISGNSREKKGTISACRGEGGRGGGGGELKSILSSFGRGISSSLFLGHGLRKPDILF